MIGLSDEEEPTARGKAEVEALAAGKVGVGLAAAAAAVDARPVERLLQLAGRGGAAQPSL